MEAVQRRLATVQLLRQRGETAGLSWMGDRELLQLCLACRVQSHDELLCYLFNREIARSGKANASRLAVQDAEFAALFGAEAAPAKSNTCARAVQGAAPQLARIERALACTLAEPLPKSAWTRAASRAACLFAMQVDAHEELLHIVLGGANRADTRRLEELRSTIEDTECEVVEVAAAIVGLSETVT